MYWFLLAAVLIAGWAAWTDFRTGQIPNWLTAGGALVGLIGHFAWGWAAAGAKAGFIELGFALAGLLFCSIAPAFMFVKGAMGGGDLKLFAAIGALCQPMLGIEAQMYAFVVAAIIAPAKLAYEGKLLQVLGNSVSLVLNPLRRRSSRKEVPEEMLTWFRLGPSIFVGALLTFVLHGALSPS
jgi:prepilin peptidase CpaA